MFPLRDGVKDIRGWQRLERLMAGDGELRDAIDTYTDPAVWRGTHIHIFYFLPRAVLENDIGASMSGVVKSTSPMEAITGSLHATLQTLGSSYSEGQASPSPRERRTSSHDTQPSMY